MILRIRNPVLKRYYNMKENERKPLNIFPKKKKVQKRILSRGESIHVLNLVNEN